MTLPWTTTVTAKGAFSGLTLTATPPNLEAMKLGCQILVDGKVASSSDSDSSVGVSCDASGFQGN